MHRGGQAERGGQGVKIVSRGTELGSDGKAKAGLCSQPLAPTVLATLQMWFPCRK